MSGRRVLVEGVIHDEHPDGGCGVLVRFNERFGGLNVAAVSEDAIREILPQEIKAGDRVWSQSYGIPARVIVIDRGFAGVRFDGDTYGWPEVSDLTLIEPAQ
jgi:hypothetical protein